MKHAERTYYILNSTFSDRMKSPWEKTIMINLVYRLNKIILNVIKLVNTTSKENY